jgi:branched-chain amino acid transport system ATP-binding protein
VDVVESVRVEGVAVIWIEHVVRALTATVNRLICLAEGRIIGDGSPDQVLSSPAVKQVFLGTEATADSLAEAGVARGAGGLP